MWTEQQLGVDLRFQNAKPLPDALHWGAYAQDNVAYAQDNVAVPLDGVRVFLFETGIFQAELKHEIDATYRYSEASGVEVVLPTTTAEQGHSSAVRRSARRFAEEQGVSVLQECVSHARLSSRQRLEETRLALLDWDRTATQRFASA